MIFLLLSVFQKFSNYFFWFSLFLSLLSFISFYCRSNEITTDFKTLHWMLDFIVIAAIATVISIDWARKKTKWIRHHNKNFLTIWVMDKKKHIIMEWFEWFSTGHAHLKLLRCACVFGLHPQVCCARVHVCLFVCVSFYWMLSCHFVKWASSLLLSDRRLISASLVAIVSIRCPFHLLCFQSLAF